MFYLGSGTIAAEHRELDSPIRSLDEYLFQNEGHPVRLDFTADILGIDHELLARLMALFAAQGIVEKGVGYLCPKCDGFLDRVPNQGNLWCDDCEKSVSFRGRGEMGVTVWCPLPSAEKTGRVPTAPPPTDSPPPPPAKTCIQFIAGDRGGTPRSLVQIPREEQTIKDAVRLGDFRDAFEFAQPVFAASIDRVIECQRSNPGIIHFVGHGEQRQMVLVRDRDLLVDMMRLNPDQVGTIFRSFGTPVRLVVFNTCHSIDLARYLTENGVVEMAIGIEGVIPDDQAVQFARTFYRQLSDGKSVREAFLLGRVHAEQLDPTSWPQLLAAHTIDPAAVVFAAAPG